MPPTKIVVKKGLAKLYVYRGDTIVLETNVAHGRNNTTPGKRRIHRWVVGPVSWRPDYVPHTWFSFGATFSPVYRWPNPRDEGSVFRGPNKFPARRISKISAQVLYRGDWHDVWKDSNPFGALMADLEPGKIELHGTSRDLSGNDQLPSMSGNEVTHGCIRVCNEAIMQIRLLAPMGTEVSIEP